MIHKQKINTMVQGKVIMYSGCPSVRPFGRPSTQLYTQHELTSYDPRTVWVNTGPTSKVIVPALNRRLE